MGHGVWHPSSVPTMKRARALSAPGDGLDTRIVRGDRLTVRKDGVQVRIFVEHVGEDVIEGTVISKSAKWCKGQYIAVFRADVVCNRKFEARITQAKLD